MILLTVIGVVISTIISTLDRVVFFFQNLFAGSSQSHLVHDLRNQFKDYKELSVEVSDHNHKANETNPRRNVLYRDVLLSRPDQIKFGYDGVTTMDELFERSVIINKDIECLQHRPIIKMHKGTEWDIPEFGPIKSETYQEVYTRVKNLSAGIVHFTKLNSGGLLGIFEDTRKEWFLTLQACFRYNITVMTVYASLGDEALIAAINETQVSVMLVNERALNKFVKVIQPKCPSLKYLIYCTNFHSDESEQRKIDYDVQSLQKVGVKSIQFEEVERLGQQLSSSQVPAVKEKATPESIALIMYTSGTTGEPKGVIILHRNILASTVALNVAIGDDKTIAAVYIAYLPMAHILELVAEHAMFLRGGTIAYGTPRTLTERGAKPIGDIAAIRPGVMVGVPRVYDTVKKGALERINSGSPIVKWLFESAFKARKAALYAGRDTPLWNALVFNKFKGLMGGRMCLMVSGGAPLSIESQEFMRICFGCSVIQGYGLTETCASGCIQSGYHPFKGHNVGPPVPCCEVKLVSVPELNYTVQDKPLPRGEVLIRGTNITSGYFKRPEITKEVFQEDGWFTTGDIGQLNMNGTFTLIDRKKNLVKLAHGEYIALERLESVYGNSPFISPNGIFVYADSFQDFPVAIALLQISYVRKWVKDNNLESKINVEDVDAICNNEIIHDVVFNDLKRVGKEGGLKKFEFINDVALVNDVWTPENGMLTAAMKLKRPNLVQKYGKILDRLYKKK